MSEKDSGTIVRAKAKVFAGERSAKPHQFLVTRETVKVWDDVAGYYTSCHSMGPSTIARIKKLSRVSL
jgi:hypothetical protein